MKSLNKKAAYREDLKDEMRNNLYDIRTIFFNNADQTTFAKYIGLSRQTYGNIENPDSSKNMTELQYVAICSLLDWKKNEYIRLKDVDNIKSLLQTTGKSEWIESLTKSSDNLSSLYGLSFLDEWMRSFYVDDSELPLTTSDVIMMAKERKLIFSTRTYQNMDQYNETMKFIKYLVNNHGIKVYVTTELLKERDNVYSLINGLEKPNDEYFRMTLNRNMIDLRIAEAVNDGILTLVKKEDPRASSGNEVMSLVGCNILEPSLKSLCQYEDIRIALQKIFLITDKHLRKIISKSEGIKCFTYKSGRVFEIKKEEPLTKENFMRIFENRFTLLLYEYIQLKGEEKREEIIQRYKEQYREIEHIMPTIFAN